MRPGRISVSSQRLRITDAGIVLLKLSATTLQVDSGEQHISKGDFSVGQGLISLQEFLQLLLELAVYEERTD